MDRTDRKSEYSADELRNRVFDLIMADKDLDSGINDAISCVGNYFGISRVYIFENNDANTHSSNTFEWCAEGTEPQIDMLQNMSFTESDYGSLFDEKGLCFCPDVSKLPDMLKDLFESQGIKATLQYAIYDKGVFRGFVGFDDCISPRPDWNDDGESLKTLVTISKLLSICLLKERNLQRATRFRVKLEESLKKEREMREEALKATVAKSRFLANVSHDMRTPLNGIIGFTHLAMESDSLEEKDDCLKKIELSEHFLSDLINETLDLSKIETGKVSLNPEPIDSLSLMNGIVTNIRSSAEAKGVELVVNSDRAKLTLINVDVLRMQEIFSNLLSNAVKFTPGGGRIDFIAECLSEGDGVLHEKFTIRDNGIGMSEKFAKIAFEPFSQENPMESNNYNGTGLGLSIVLQLVKLMKGRIELHSEMGKGSEFTIFMDLPLAKEEERQKDNSHKWAEYDLNGLNILVCEDHPINAELVRRLLVKKKARVTFAANGKQGVELFADSEPGYFAAVLMDIRMPVMNGLEAVAAIRSLNRPDAEKIPIIAMTANAYDEDKREALVSGMNAHLSKPIVPAELYRTLQSEISKKKEHN